MLAAVTKIILSSFLRFHFQIFLFIRRHCLPQAYLNHNILTLYCECKKYWEFHNANKNQRKFPQRTIKRTTEFCEFGASGKRPAFIGVENERDKTEAKRGQ